MEDEQDKTISQEIPSVEWRSFAPGELVDNKYQIVSLIGRGGMGSVYRVHQMFLGKDFALKALDLQQRSEASSRRFNLEARAAAQLQHPNLVGVHGFGLLEDEQPYLIMDIVEGSTLADILKERETLPIDFVVSLAIQLCFGLAYAHAKGVVHRDIKPGNIMLLHADKQPCEGMVKIVDFGIAKLTQSEDGEIQSLTRTGEIFGSPLYMSPEQCKGAGVDRRSDIYSLGCVLYECLTGTPPFLGETAMSTMLKRLSDEPLSLKQATLGRDFPDVLEHIIRKMLSVDPDERYQDMGAVARDFMSFQKPEIGLPVIEVKESRVEKKDLKVSHKAILALATIAFFVSATALFDRVFLYPRFFAPTKVKKPIDVVGSENPFAVSEQDVGSAPKSRRVPSLNEQATLLGKAPNPLSSQSDIPQVLVETVPSGKTTVLEFPDDFGSLHIDHRRYLASGKIMVPPDSKITYRLSSIAASNEHTLENLTGLKFHRIDFNSFKQITDHYIKILKKIPFLEQVGLDSTSVTSLEPLYKSKTITYLEVAQTRVPSSEILKIERLKKLRFISFGPVPDAYRVFDALNHSESINNVIYNGIRKPDDTRGFGLTNRDIDSLGKLTNLKHITVDSSPNFNDANLQKLLALQNLNSLKVVDCGLTGKCIPTLAKFKKLRELSLTTEGWSEEDIRTLSKKYFFERHKSHQEERAENRSGVEAVRKFISN